MFSTREKPGRVARAALLSLIVFDAVEATVRWNPASPPELLYRETPALGKLREVVGRDRFLADRGVPPDVLLPLGMRGIGSYGSSHPARFAHLVDAIAPKRSGRPSNQWLHAWRLPPAWRDALSVRAVLVDPLDREGPEACVPEGLVPLSAGEVSIFRNPTALPRARLFPLARIVAAENETEALVRVRARDFDARTHVVLELGDSFSSWTPGDPLESGPLLEAAIVEGADGPERVRVRTGHREGAFLVLADTFASGWSATVDGTPAEIFPANVAFRAVFVPRGEHDVLFSYGPPGWPIAPAVSALACVAALACLALGNVRRPGLRARRAG
ncbi:hypothetical protein HY251_06185 [bacterium]|nr:hypothetical protein [bacterium]